MDWSGGVKLTMRSVDPSTSQLALANLSLQMKSISTTLN
jgi:hypothetical protein